MDVKIVNIENSLKKKKTEKLVYNIYIRRIFLAIILLKLQFIDNIPFKIEISQIDSYYLLYSLSQLLLIFSFKIIFYDVGTDAIGRRKPFWCHLRPFDFFSLPYVSNITRAHNKNNNNNNETKKLRSCMNNLTSIGPIVEIIVK